MLKKFLFYFGILLCSGAVFFGCSKKNISRDQIGTVSHVRWLPAQPLTSVSSELSIETVAREALFRFVDPGSPAIAMPEVTSDLHWISPKVVEIELKPGFQGFSAVNIVEGLKNGFHVSDSVLVEALSELIQNGREYAQGRIPFTSVGIRAVSARKVELRLRRRSPSLLALVLSHPATWPTSQVSQGPLHGLATDSTLERRFERNPSYSGPAVRLTSLELRRVEDPFTRTSLVMSGEADFTGEITPSLLAAARKSERYHEIFSAWRLLLVINPTRPPFKEATFRRELAHSIDPRELAKFIPSVGPIAHLLERKPMPEKVGWFASLEPRADHRPLTHFTAPLKLRAVLPYPHSEGINVLSEATTNLIAQLGKVGVNAEAMAPSFQLPTADSLAEPDLTLLFLPALPLASVTWSEIMGFLGRQSDIEDSLSEWELTRDDERLEIAIESQLSDKEAMLVPLGAHRKAYLASNRLDAIKLSPFGFWDWSHVALALH